MLSKDDMKGIKGGNPPYQGGSTCATTELNYRCGPELAGGCITPPPNSEHCCCSMDGYEDDCLTE